MRSPEELLAEQVSLFPATWAEPALAAIATAQEESADEIERLRGILDEAVLEIERAAAYGGDAIPPSILQRMRDIHARATMNETGTNDRNSDITRTAPKVEG